MGEIKLNGLGYDTKPSYENNLKGLNAGYLNYSKTRLQGHPAWTHPWVRDIVSKLFLPRKRLEEIGNGQRLD